MSEHSTSEPFLRNPQVRAALEQLGEARHAAQTLHLDVWAFAVEMSTLLSAGCTMPHLRLLVSAGYVDHAEDVTKPSSRTRAFRPENPMKFGPQTCFVLTEAGLTFLEQAASAPERELRTAPGDSASPASRSTGGRKVPLWDATTRELRAGSRVVTQFRRPAPMLELVLASFQETDWPSHLDDPLPPKVGSVPEERLRDTVRRLNRCQKPLRVHFFSDGLGAGIRWEWVDGESEDPTDKPRISHG